MVWKINSLIFNFSSLFEKDVKIHVVIDNTQVQTGSNIHTYENTNINLSLDWIIYNIFYILGYRYIST